jgi:hypothetical protein
MRHLHPVGRVGRPEEVAAALAYLLSDEASFINGATVPVDGGRSDATPKKHELSPSLGRGHGGIVTHEYFRASCEGARSG